MWTPVPIPIIYICFWLCKKKLNVFLIDYYRYFIVPDNNEKFLGPTWKQGNKSQETSVEHTDLTKHLRHRTYLLSMWIHA